MNFSLLLESGMIWQDQAWQQSTGAKKWLLHSRDVLKVITANIKAGGPSIPDSLHFLTTPSSSYYFLQTHNYTNPTPNTDVSGHLSGLSHCRGKYATYKYCCAGCALHNSRQQHLPRLHIKWCSLECAVWPAGWVLVLFCSTQSFSKDPVLSSFFNYFSFLYIWTLLSAPLSFFIFST